MSSQFIYLKSSRYLKDVDGGSILVNSSELPYQFINSFREPIRVNPKSQIEIVSADLNVEPLHDISSLNDNDALTYSFGSVAEEFLQKLVKIPNGVYSNEQLANKIRNIISDTNILDGTIIDVSYEKTTGFSVQFFMLSDNFNDTDNIYDKLTSKMGFQASTAEQNAGVGTDGNEITIENRNSISHPNTLIKNSSVSVLSSTTLTDTKKPTNLISNTIAPTTHGIDGSNGTTSMVLRPIKHKVYGATFLSGATGKTFKVVDAATYTGLTIAPYTGSNSYDFKVNIGGVVHNVAFVKTKTFWDTLTLPNSVSTSNLPWGHFAIVNNTDVAINTTLASNTYSLLLDTNTYEWKMFSTTTGNTQFTFSCDNDATYVDTQGTLTSLGNWGSAALSLSRGECAIVGTNQVDNTNRFTRARVYNNTGDATNDVLKEVYADYSVLISPNKAGTDNLVKLVYGTQDASKVAGNTDWLSLTNSTEFSLKGKLPNITDDDNIIITASMNAWYCMDFFIGHDNSGDCGFTNEELIATTKSDAGGDLVVLPMNFNECSYPIMPVCAVSNGYVKNEQQALVFGNYSDNLISTHSLAKLNAYMISTWGSKQEIPARQPKATYTNYCRDYNLVDRTIKIEPDGFSGVNTIKDYLVVDGGVQTGYNIEENPAMMKLGMPLEQKDRDRVSAAGFSNQPPTITSTITGRDPFISKLNLHMGMPDVLIVADDDDDYDPDENPEMKFESENEIIYNESQNFIVNLSNLGKITGQNSSTNSVSAIAGIIPSAQLTEFAGNSKHYKASYPQPVSINAKTDELINNFEVNISNDDGTPATSLRHPINITCRLTEN